ncbi:MAG: hypothetical protein M3Y84_14635 [Acidobacteriota bacterium]|nr:hypothetical protein [Acidobacteriota bacterium]
MKRQRTLTFAAFFLFLNTQVGYYQKRAGYDRLDAQHPLLNTRLAHSTSEPEAVATGPTLNPVTALDIRTASMKQAHKSRQKKTSFA